MDYQWSFGFVARNYHLLLAGLWGTLKLAALSLTLGLIIGLLAGIGRTTRHLAPRLAATCYVELFRNTPGLVQLLFFFYVIPLLTGMRSDPFVAATLSLSLYTGAYAAEIYRGGIESIERGQWEAAKALGFGYSMQMRYVVLPQAIKRMIPAFTNRAIELVKTTALSALIAYGELVYHTKLLADIEFRPIEAFTVLAVLFSAILLPLSYGAVRLERRLSRSDA